MSVSKELADLMVSHGELRQELKDLMNYLKADKLECEKIQAQQGAWISSLNKKVDELEHLRWYFRGVAAVMTLSFMYFKEEIKRKVGVK